jgi:transcriptional regulator with XRE-family HTH domain
MAKAEKAALVSPSNGNHRFWKQICGILQLVEQTRLSLPGEKNVGTVRNMPPELGDFSIALSILRISRGWSQDQVAKASGITNSALSEYERGKKVPELKSVKKIVKALGYELSAIERTEDFLRELRAESQMEVRREPDGSYSLVPVSLPAGLARRPAIDVGGGEDFDLVAASGPLRTRARRVAAQVGQAATGFSLLLFDILIGQGGQGGQRGQGRE